MNKVGNLHGKNVLFLQGPMGIFFKKLDRTFRKRGAFTYKIGFNAGDRFFAFGDNYTGYKGTRDEWSGYIVKFLKEKNIHKIFLFGDCRFYQAQTIAIANDLGLEIFVFEEGYLRPHYVTMEKFGVNDHSCISRNPSFYRKLTATKNKPPMHALHNKWKMVYSATMYYLMGNVFHRFYPHYKHHRDFSSTKEFFFGVRGLFRKIIYPYFEKKYLEKITGELSKRYFFIPLQTYNDFQILQHSKYGSIEKFIIEVLESFSENSNESDWLVFKHHPVDRGRKNYRGFILDQAELLDVESRILVVHDVFLPTCLQNALGTITINSTVGLTSVEMGIPTITLGNAIYDIDGLTCKGMSLQEFWESPAPPEKCLYENYKSYLIDTTQLNGSFYGRFPVELEADVVYQD